MLYTSCYLVVTYLIPEPNFTPGTYPGYGSYYQAFVQIIGGPYKVYTGESIYRLVRYVAVPDCGTAVQLAREFVAGMTRQGMFTPPLKDYTVERLCH
jgi:hypothetical protein